MEQRAAVKGASIKVGLHMHLGYRHQPDWLYKHTDMHAMLSMFKIV